VHAELTKKGESRLISQTVEYALRAVVYLADQEESHTVQQIAERTKVPVPYLSKVLQGLCRASLVQSQRGVHGGFRLAVSAEELTIWEIVNAVDPLPRIRQCPLGLPSHVKLCPLHRRVDDAMAMVERAFRESTVAELLAEPTTSKPLCNFPR
jgi:Rrf2 family nitric oxide-sensitive transcriptional repressor